MVSDQQWSDEQMMDALQRGVEADAQPEQAPESAPVGETQQNLNNEVQPAEPVAPAQQNTADLFEGTPVNPDELPEELKPLAKQLQAAFTQKTQALAERSKQIEALGDLEVIQEAVDFANRINDPANWVQLHAELTTAMQQYGLSPADASAAAAEAMGAQPVESPAAQALNLDEIDDPELAPLAQMLRDQQAQIEALKNEREEERQTAQAEYERQAFLGELQRQENAIRGAHPDWDDEKILTVYQMSSFFNGNLTQAAERLEGILAAERALYLSNKESVATNLGTQVPPRGAGTPSQRVEHPETIKDAEAEAMEFFKNRVAYYEGQ